jgi:chemotaxis protein CheX
MTMNVKFLNPFLDAASEVLHAEVNVNVTKGNLTLQKSALTTNDVSVLINLVGQIQGVVIYEMSSQTGMAVVSRILDQEFKEFDNLAQSGIAELGNVISGKATVEMSKAGYDSTISPPTLIIGKGTQISTVDFNRIVVPMSTEIGEIIVHLALRESPEDQQAVNFVPLIQSAVAKK